MKFCLLSLLSTLQIRTEHLPLTFFSLLALVLISGKIKNMILLNECERNIIQHHPTPLNIHTCFYFCFCRMLFRTKASDSNLTMMDGINIFHCVVKKNLPLSLSFFLATDLAIDIDRDIINGCCLGDDNILLLKLIIIQIREDDNHCYSLDDILT